jgi:hypothetical protein
MMSRLKGSFAALEFGYWISEKYVGRELSCVSAMHKWIMQLTIWVSQKNDIVFAANNHYSCAVPECLGIAFMRQNLTGEVVGKFVCDCVVYGIPSTAMCERNKKNPKPRTDCAIGHFGSQAQCRTDNEGRSLFANVFKTLYYA